MSRASKRKRSENAERGFLLIGLVVAMFLIALFLTVAAPTVARSLERDKEVESEHRAQQYVRAIHNYYLKFGSYPTSLEQLISQNNMHFLRQQYKDPLTGGDYRLIHYGEAKTQVKGFFGEPLDGMTGSSGALGGGAGASSMGGSSLGGPLGAGNGSTGSASGSGSTFGSGGFSLGTSSFGAGNTAGGSAASGAGAGTGTGAADGTSPGTGGSAAGGTSATQIQGSKGMIVGVGSNGTGHGLVEWNGSANIEDWEFLYDHRTWQMRQRVSITGGAMGSAPGSSSMNSVSAGSSTLGGGPASQPGTTSGGSGSSSGSSSPVSPASGSAPPQN